MHNSFQMHVSQCRAELDEIFPNRPLWDKSLLLLEVLDHSGEVPSVCQLKDDVELVVLYKGR